ncbi:transcriptional regulator [Actinorhabdospora filicis]|uniref:Transcriptional regulator n=1 Tax=Actinorhabdospora filicis TaxID=1785913 RepID=A0A9W6SJH7_9ACTN|nr:YafY family protein [Actinorhabdospora filicis]GLZ76734.1 transcriptional regulator [Actinorhabdospora filicis]
MASTSARTLKLLSLLQTHRYWPGTELAGRLDVSPRTLRRDIDRLRELGYPVDAHRGVDGGYQLATGTSLPPLLLDDEEAVAITIGLMAAAAGAVSGVEESAVMALTKVVQAMPPRLRHRVEALRASTVAAPPRLPAIDSAALTVIALACRDAERLRFGYTAHGGAVTARLVEPLRLVPHAGRWYLVAWDLDRHAWRTFRLDRLVDAAPTGDRFRPRELPGGDAAAYVREQISGVPTRHHVEVLVRAPVEQVAAAAGRWGRVAAAEGGTLLTMDVHDLADPATILAGLGAPFTVLGPPELRDHLRRAGELFTDAAQSPSEDQSPSEPGTTSPAS